MKQALSHKCASHEASPPLFHLADVPLFSGLETTFLEKLEAAGNPHKFSKNHVIFMQDDLCEWFYVVRSGWVKLFRQTLDGDEVIIDILPSGKVFGETDIFDNRLYACSAEVVQDAEIMAYPVSILRHEIASNQDFALKMLKHVIRGQREKDKEIEHRTIQNAPQRLGCFLLRLMPAKKQGPVVLHLPYDKTLIASRLGMQSETFSRALARLKKDVNLKVRGSTIEIASMDDLITYTCAACSNVYPCED